MIKVGDFNRQGRSVSDSMRLRDFKRYLSTRKPEPKFEVFEYRGFEICGTVGKGWFVMPKVENAQAWPVGYTTKDKAREGVDRCLALRAEMAGA